MSDYIKRDDLVSAMEELLRSPYANNNSDNRPVRQFTVGVRNALKLVRDMAKDEVPDSMKIPSADVRENVRGKWLIRSRCDVCSVCGYSTGRYTGNYNYCPYCGADMRVAEL